MGGRVDKLAQEILDETAGRAGQHLLWRGHLDDPAVIHENDHIGQVQRLLHIVGDKHKGLVQLLLEGAHLLLEGAPGHGVQGGEGLVHQHDGGRGGQGTENADALLLPAGHLGGVLVGVLLIGQVDQLQQLGDPVVDFFLGVPGHTHGQSDVVLHRHMGEQAALLDDIAHQAGKLAMENGDIDMVVDYSGQVYLSVLGLPLNTDPDEVYDILVDKMKNDYNIAVSAPLGYNNTYAMSVRPEIAEQYQLETLTDLMAVAPELRLGCTADFTQREDALPRLESTFNTEFAEVNALDVAVRYTAIDSGQVDVIDAFATDALLSKFDLVQLEDDASFFPPYYAVNFIRQECLDKYPELEEVLALLDGRISNEAMAAMNAEVDLEGRNAADVAHDFLVEEGLI